MADPSATDAGRGARVTGEELATDIAALRPSHVVGHRLAPSPSRTRHGVRAELAFDTIACLLTCLSYLANMLSLRQAAHARKGGRHEAPPAVHRQRPPVVSDGL